MDTQVKLPKEYKAELKESAFKEEVVEILKNLKTLEVKRLHPKTTKLLCNIVENSPSVQKYKLNKKELVITILKDVFNLNDDELKFIDIQIEDLVENKLIKKLPWLYKTSKKLFHFLVKLL